MLPTIDRTSFPLTRITYPSVVTVSDVDAYAAQLGALLADGPVGTVVDIRALDPHASGAAGRRYLASAIDRTTRAHPGKLIAEAIVMDSSVLRGLYTAYCWIRSDSSYPSKAFRELESAEAWVRSQLAKQRAAAES